MEATSTLTAGSFGEDHFGQCELGDARLRDRVIKTANRFMAHPGGTLPDKLDRNADLIGFYRLANNPKVSHDKLIAAHVARTRRLMQECQAVVLVIHDTTELNFSGLDVEDLGQIGSGKGSGYLAHNSLAYDVDSREVLGLANQVLHARRKVPPGESRKAKREHPDRESRLWKRGFSALGPVPEGKLRVNVADRGADLNEFIEAVEAAGDHYLIRSRTNRNIRLETDDGQTRGAKLHDHAATLPVLGTRTVKVENNTDQVKRTATVEVRCGPVRLRCRYAPRGDAARRQIGTFVVHVQEKNPPPNVEPLKWILLTNVPTATVDEANRRIDWYAARPVVEEYHKAMKTGCGVEMPQFTTGQALRVAIAMQSVVATQLLRLRDLARSPESARRPAIEVIEPEYVDAATHWRSRDLSNMTVRDFLNAVANLGGHLNRKHDGPPGWLVLWRGWTKLQLLVQGALGAQKRRCV